MRSVAMSLIGSRQPGESFISPPLTTETPHFNGNIYEETIAEMVDPLAQEQIIPEAASINRDDKLLSFRLPTYNFTLLDYSLRRTSLSLSAQLHGMFFMAEPSSDGAVDSINSELTCYRRNLFQVTGSITLPRTMRYIMTDQGDRIPIISQELTISATESVEGHPVKLISVPWKTPASNNNTSTPEDKNEKEPTSIQLDTMSNQDMDADYATFPIAWKRLQFRIATANNGRRKELQQHFVVRLKVVATVSSGAKVSVCEAASGAIIVRGRSPRNFQARKDMPVGRDTGGSRKSNSHPTTLNRHTSNGSQTTVKHAKVEPQSLDDGTSAFNFNIESATPSDHGSAPRNSTRIKVDPSSLPAPTFSGRRSSPSTSKSPPALLSGTDGSERLSFLENSSTHEVKTDRTTSTGSSEAMISPFKRPSLQQTTSTTSIISDSGFACSGIANMDPADLLYEYFPLGLDDWQPPVDAIYRPHVVHHIASTPVAAVGGVSLGGGRNKRYFSEDFG